VLAVDGCTARDLRAAAHMVDLARQLTGLPHPPTALAPARILLFGNFISFRKKSIHNGIRNCVADPRWDRR